MTASRTDAVAQSNPVIRFLRLVRFSHTIFALPFALGALLVAANGRPAPRTLLLMLACMVLGRTAAMLFNRLSDWSLDQKNPRTASRHRLVRKSAAWGLLVVSAAGFLITRAVLYPTPAPFPPAPPRLIFFFFLS